MLIRSGKRLLRDVPPMPCRVRQVRQCFYEHRRRYGSRRIAKQLKLGRFRVRSLMKRENLRAIAPKSFVPRTSGFTARRTHFAEFVEELDRREAIGGRRGSWRYYLFAALKREMVLSSNISGQVDSSDYRVGSSRADDCRFSGQGVADGSARWADLPECHYSY